MINVFLENDLANADLQNPKILALEQILNHLMMRVKNSSQVNPPWVGLLDIFNQPQYIQFENQTVKRHAANRIMEFIFESYNRIPQDQDQSYLHVLLQAMDNDDLRYVDKCRLFLLLLHRMSAYLKSNETDKLANTILQPIMTQDLKLAFMQISIYYLLNTIAPNSVYHFISQCFQAAIGEMQQKFRDTLKETVTQFNQIYDETIIKITGAQSIFTPEEQLPILMVCTLSSINKTKDLGELSIRSVFAAIDTKNMDISEKIYKMIFNEMYIYKDFSEREDSQIDQLPVGFQIKLIEYLIKFECSASQHPLNQKLVFHCFFSTFAQSLEKVGLNFLLHMIRFNDLSKESTMNFLKQTLLKILHDNAFTEDSQSMSLQLLSNMGLKNYDAINDDIQLAIDTFQRLKLRIQQLQNDGVLALRNDYTCNNYIEALNKFRDCFEQKLLDNSKRILLLQYVLNYLNKEGSKSNSELTYLLFLYLSRLDKDHTLQSSILLYSIILKDHEDIKIKKEAQFQLDKFQKDSQVPGAVYNRILRPFLKDVEGFLQRNQMNYISDGDEDGLQQFLSFNSTQFQPAFVDKIMEITSFVIRFFQEERENKDKIMDLGDQEEICQEIERLLVMNLNQNYTMIKSDFTQPLNLIYQYLKEAQPIGVLRTFALEFIQKLAIGSVNLSQRVLSLKINLKILRSIDNSSHYIQNFLQSIANLLNAKDKPFDQLPHETKLNLLYGVTILRLQRPTQDIQDNLLEMMNSVIHCTNLSPNIMEQIKFATSCLKKIGERIDLSNDQEMHAGELLKIVDAIQGYIKRNEIDIIIANFAGIMKRSQKEFQIGKANEMLESMIGSEDVLIEKVELLIGKVFKAISEESTLIVKRNSTIYLYQTTELYGKQSKAIQDRFLDLQKVFLKFLFDRKAYMQDLSSKALSKIYHLGSPDVKTLLVDALSKTLSGEKSAAEHQEKDENQELLLEFKDNTSTEQREKLKTYKDLCNIAVELGHRELIYQFLEVHRHLAHYQDIKNAAKGLSSIILLDEKLRGDLLKIAPKILLLSYDHNDEVKETMKELWSSLIEIEKEEQIINSRWSEIFKEAFDGLTSKEYRRRQSSALALSDLLNQREWPQIKLKFRELFLTSLGLLDDDKDTVKMAAFQLVKTLKRITLKHGNIYTNSNVAELEEVLQIVIPMILDECMKSNMEMVKFFSVDMLSEIVKSSQNQNMMNKLKFQNKYEKQLVFNYNSEQQMKEIMNKHLDRIVVEVIMNLSQMNKAVERLNQFEQMAMAYGYNISSKAKSKLGISEAEINDLRLKYTKESAWGEILKICRDQMTEQTFSKILNDLIQLMRVGHDMITKSTAISFVQDIILENKTHLITPQNSKKIAQKLVEIYSLNSVGNALAIKEALRILYSQCLGTQMKILKDYPKTVQQIIESVVGLPRELEEIICMNVYEIAKNLPEQMLKEGSGKIFGVAIPMLYINRYKSSDHGLKQLSRKAYSYLQEQIPMLTEHNQEEIFRMIKDLLDSASYDDRVAACLAMQDLNQKLSDEDIRNSQIVQEVVDKLHTLIQGKYFNNKETIVEGFMSILKLPHDRLLSDYAFINSYVETCLQQIQKYGFQDQSKLNYKNTILKSLTLTLSLSKLASLELKHKLYDHLVQQDLREALKRVSDKASMIDTIDEFEEKREEEKQTLQLAIGVYECLPGLVEEEEQSQEISDISLKYYQNTNWIIRNSILKWVVSTYKKNNDKLLKPIVQLSEYLFQNVAEVGEKYDTNLALMSEVTLMYTEKYFNASNQNTFNSIVKIVELLSERSQDVKKNIDVIKRNINLQ